MDDTGSSSNGSFLPDWLGGERQNLAIAGILWLVVAAIYWLDMESLAETDDLVVGAIFGALALYYFAMAVFADQTSLERQSGSCRWSWNW